MRSARGPRSWLPRSWATRRSPGCGSIVSVAAPPTHPATRPHAHARVRGQAERRARAHAAHALAALTHIPRPHRACAPPRPADNKIGDKGAKELAAALKANASLTTLDLTGVLAARRPLPARSARHHRARHKQEETEVQCAPRAPAAPPHRHTRAREAGGVCGRASPKRTPHARSPRPPPALAPLACLRQCDRRRGGPGAGRRTRGQHDHHHAGPQPCVPRPPVPQSPARHRRIRTRVQDGTCGAPRPESARDTYVTLSSPTPRVPPPPRAAGNKVNDQAALATIQNRLKANDRLVWDGWSENSFIAHAR